MSMDVQKELNQAMELHREGKLKEAKQKYLNVLSYTDNEDLYFLMTLVCQDLSEYTEAIKYAKLGEKLNPANLDFIKAIASSYDVIRDHKNALLYYEKLMKLQPKDAQVYIMVAKHLYYLNDILQAAKFYKEATKIEPSYDVKFEPIGNILG